MRISCPQSVTWAQYMQKTTVKSGGYLAGMDHKTAQEDRTAKLLSPPPCTAFDLHQRGSVHSSGRVRSPQPAVKSGSFCAIFGSLCLSVPPLPLAQRGRSSPGRAVVPLGAPTPCCERTIHTQKHTRGCTRARASPDTGLAGRWSSEKAVCDS